MKRKLILFIGFCLTSWNISQAQDYVKLGNDCFEKGDYECAKRNYSAQKEVGITTGMDAKIEQCDSCLKILNVADFLFSDKDYARAKVKYNELLSINPKDPHARARIALCNTAISSSVTRPDTPREVPQTQTQQTATTQTPATAPTNTPAERTAQTNVPTPYPTIDKHPNINISGLYRKGESLRSHGVYSFWGGLAFVGVAAAAISEDMKIYGYIIGSLGGALTLTSIPVWTSGKIKIKKARRLYNEAMRIDRGNVSELKVGFTGNGVGLAFTF